MIVLHALWDTVGIGRLRVWAESASLPLKVPERANKQKTQPHPFTLVQEPLLEVVSTLTDSLLVKSSGAEVLTLRLPSTTRGPLPSPELVLEEAVSREQKAELRWWDVVTLMFEPGAALDFLLALPDTPAHGVVFGSSLRFWMETAKFALELITRRCFMPALQETQRGRTITCRAAWEVVLAPDDARRFHRLAQAMPPVCWAFVPPGEKPATLLQDFVLHFLNHVIDAFVRGQLASTSLLPSSIRGRFAGRALPEQWLCALSMHDPELHASPEELKQFSSAMRTWLDQARPVATGAPFRTCFRLDAPSEESEDRDIWRISFHLQSNDDPSLLVPAEKVWRERSSTLTFLTHTFENPQERLLADLGKATRLFPALEQSLQMAHPTDLALNTEQAYAFLRASAPLLEQSRFGVLVPPWWQKREARVGVKMQVKPQASVDGSGLMGLSSIVDYNWNVAIGDNTVSQQEFEELVSLKRPLVNVRGQWVELRPQEVEAAIAFFKKKRARSAMSLGEALRVGLGQDTTEVGLPVVGMDAEGWIKDAFDRLSNNVPLSLIEEPPAFHGKLRPYQLRGVSWLEFLRQFGFGACLADDMGLGKTVQLISLLLYERYIREKSKISPVLLICPMSIVGNWHRELQRFAPSLSVMVHHGPDRLSSEAFIEEAQRHDVVISTYAIALRDQEELSAIEWEHVVVDEAQNIKNETAKQTQAIKQLRARHRIALTGTPVENRLSELWSIMEFLNPGYLGSATDFRQRFALPIERYHNAEQAATLKRMIQPFVLRRLKTDKEIISDLPDKLEMKVFCNLTREQASLYEAVVKEMLEKIEQADGITRRGLVLSALMKLKQVCNHPAHFMADGSNLAHRSGKLARLEEMLEEVLAEGDKALIFTQFAEMGLLLQHYLQEAFGRETLFLHGGTSKKQRDILVQRFQEEHRGAPLFILSLKAGGVGLNLTAANHVFHFDRWWNPAVENQATDRAFRIGQQKNVQVHKFVCVGTLEERINQMIEQKKDLAERIVGSGEHWLTEMSTAQLRELFALSREAVGE